MALVEGVVGLLRLAELSGGQIDTRIRIHKEAYLVALAGDPAFNASEFSYHHYGPYNRGLSDALQAAVSSGLLEEEAIGGSDDTFTRYRYRLTEGGTRFLSRCAAPTPAFRRVVDACKNRPWRALELAATVRFLERSEGRDRDDALQEALRLKPATKDFVPQALEVLSET